MENKTMNYEINVLHSLYEVVTQLCEQTVA